MLSFQNPNEQPRVERSDLTESDDEPEYSDVLRGEVTLPPIDDGVEYALGTDGQTVVMPLCRFLPVASMLLLLLLMILLSLIYFPTLNHVFIGMYVERKGKANSQKSHKATLCKLQKAKEIFRDRKRNCDGTGKEIGQQRQQVAEAKNFEG